MLCGKEAGKHSEGIQSEPCLVEGLVGSDMSSRSQNLCLVQVCLGLPIFIFRGLRSVQAKVGLIGLSKFSFSALLAVGAVL